MLLLSVVAVFECAWCFGCGGGGGALGVVNGCHKGECGGVVFEGVEINSRSFSF